ncbi:MAG: type II secretion system F family protein [Pirellulaceae bacterium]
MSADEQPNRQAKTMLTIIIAIAAFVGVAAFAAAVMFLFRGDTKSQVEDRLDVLTGAGPAATPGGQSEASVLAHPLDDMPGVLESVFSRLFNLRLTLEQAGMTISPPKFLLICGGASLLGGVAIVACRLHVAFAPVAAIVMGLLPFAFLWFKRKRRLRAFAKQLPDALELVSRALRAGHSLASGLNLAASEMADPLGSEFTRCYEEQNLGIAMEDALEQMTERVPNLDLRFFATAVILQRQTGGDLAEILDKIGALIRERFKIWGQIQALTGEGRLSGIVLLALPPVLFIVMYRLNQDYVMMLFDDPLGNQMLIVAVVLQIVGALVIKKIIDIKV